MNRGPFLLACFGALIVALILLSLFVCFSPVFRTYRLLFRLAAGVIFVHSAEAAHPLSDHFYKEIRGGVHAVSIPRQMFDFEHIRRTIDEFIPKIAYIVVGGTAIFAIISILWLLYNIIPHPRGWTLRHHQPRPDALRLSVLARGAALFSLAVFIGGQTKLINAEDIVPPPAPRGPERQPPPEHSITIVTLILLCIIITWILFRFFFRLPNLKGQQIPPEVRQWLGTHIFGATIRLQEPLTALAKCGVAAPSVASNEGGGPSVQPTDQ